MKNTILENSEQLVKDMNAKLNNTGYSVEGIFLVGHGRGTRRDQLIITFCKIGEYTLNYKFNTETLKDVSSQILGDKNKDRNLSAYCDTFPLYSTLFVPLLKELKQTETKEEGYTVGNRSFNSYESAVSYCNGCDFEPEYMIQTV